MWYDAYMQCDNPPEEIDTKSSPKWVYIRKDFTFVRGDALTVDHWKYKERRIKKEDWELFRKYNESKRFPFLITVPVESIEEAVKLMEGMR